MIVMTWEYWLIAISIGVFALAFLGLVIFLAITLMSVRATVKNVDHKVHSFDPLFRVVNKAGCAVERKASKVKQLSEDVEEEIVDLARDKRKERVVNTAMEVAEWALIGLALWQKIKQERER
jgi:uncharacterized protein YoxC